MPTRQFIRGEIGSADINRLNVAYGKALRMLYLVDRDDPISKIVARKVVDVGTSGVIDPGEIADVVVRHFSGNAGQMAGHGKPAQRRVAQWAITKRKIRYE